MSAPWQVQRRRRGIFVESRPQKCLSSVGAAYSTPDGAEKYFHFVLQLFRADGAGNGRRLGEMEIAATTTEDSSAVQALDRQRRVMVDPWHGFMNRVARP